MDSAELGHFSLLEKIGAVQDAKRLVNGESVFTWPTNAG